LLYQNSFAIGARYVFLLKQEKRDLFLFVLEKLLTRVVVSKCDVSQQITAVDGRYMLDIVVGERVEFII